MTNHTVIRSHAPAEAWEDALVSGNGATGVMVMGEPLDETVVVCHEKLWVSMVDVARDVTDMREAWVRARALAAENRFEEAEKFIFDYYTRANQKRWDVKHLVKGRRLPTDRDHPAFGLRLDQQALGEGRRYERLAVLDTGEIVVAWDDQAGRWERRVFVSRPHDAIVLRVLAPAGEKLSCSAWLEEAPGKLDGDLGEVRIEHSDEEMYFHAAYARTLGKDEPEGYHALGRVLCRGGQASAADGGRIDVADADELLILMRVEYLDRAGQADRAKLRAALEELPDSYDALLAPHAAEHGDMLRRVRLDLGAGPEYNAEDLLAEAHRIGPTPALLQALHDVGRYALIGSSGELPPALMGIWGDTWTPPWDGRFTFDSNLNLAIAAGSQGNLPEAMESYFRFIEHIARDWPRNAERLYGCRGYVSELSQGWRDGLTMWGTYPWTGGAGWLGSYFYDHYLYTGDREFLRTRALPMLQQTALFYEDFLSGTEDGDGHYVFYPSISPENTPSKVPLGKPSDIVPNATSEVAICRQVLTNLIAACRELGVQAESIPRWQRMLAKLPPYRLNADGAIAEWSCDGLEDNYAHRHNSHLYGVYPALEINPVKTPDLARAARRAIQMRLDAGRGNASAHGLLHLAFFAARLRDPDLLWQTLDEFAREGYLYRSLITSHNSDHRIYNLDATLSLPAVLMEMLVHSEPGMIHLLPALPAKHLPKGRIEGVLARGAVTIERLAWDVPAGTIDLALRSATAQAVQLTTPGPKGQVARTQPVDLPAGATVPLQLSLPQSP